MRFYVIENASIDSRPYDRFDALSTVHTNKIKSSKTIARCDVPVEFYVYATDTRACYIFGHPYDMYEFSFWSNFKSVFKSMLFRWKRSAFLVWTGPQLCLYKQ